MFSEVNGEPVELSSIIDVRDGTHDSPKAQATGYYLITSKHLLPLVLTKLQQTAYPRQILIKSTNAALLKHRIF